MIDCTQAATTYYSPQEIELKEGSQWDCLWQNRISEVCQSIWDKFLALIRYLSSFVYPTSWPIPEVTFFNSATDIGIPGYQLEDWKKILKEIDCDFEDKPKGFFSSSPKELDQNVKLQALSCLYPILEQIDRRLERNECFKIRALLSLNDLPSKHLYKFHYSPGDSKQTLAKTLIEILKKEYVNQGFKFSLSFQCTVLQAGIIGPIIMVKHWVPECHNDCHRAHNSKEFYQITGSYNRGSIEFAVKKEFCSMQAALKAFRGCI